MLSFFDVANQWLWQVPLKLAENSGMIYYASTTGKLCSIHAILGNFLCLIAVCFHQNPIIWPHMGKFSVALHYKIKSKVQ